LLFLLGRSEFSCERAFFFFQNIPEIGIGKTPMMLAGKSAA